MREKYTITLMDRYSAEERVIVLEAINKDHARRIAHSQATESEYIREIIKAGTIHLVRYAENGRPCWDNIEAETQAQAIEILKEIEPLASHLHSLEILGVETFDNYPDAIAAAYAGESERVQDATSAALSRAGMLAEEPKPEREPKTYTTTEGHDHQETTSATQALAWYREGRRVTVWGRRPDGSQYHTGLPKIAPKERDADQENREHCRRIAEELDAHVNGDVRRCPDCGEVISRDWETVGDVFRCPECHATTDTDDWEPLGVYDFLEDALDIEFRTGGRAADEFRSVRIMVACGGPNIYLDTASKDIELYWWGDRARYPMSYEAVEALDEWAAEYWGCL